jgi:hypothetical protein
MPAATDHREAIAVTLKRFGILPLGAAVTALLECLGYHGDRRLAPTPTRACF